MPNKNYTIKNRVYFITKDLDKDLYVINDILKNKESFIEKIYKSKIDIKEGEEKIFINVILNIELDIEIFNKFSKKINKLLNQNYKIFYKDANKNYFVYTPEIIKDDIKKSWNKFIDDE